MADVMEKVGPEVIPPLIGRAIAAVVSLLVTLVILVLLKSSGWLPEGCEKYIQKGWLLFHLFPGLLLGMVIFEIYWILSRWNLDRGDIPGWSRLMPPPTDSNSIGEIEIKMKQLTWGRLNAFMSLSMVPFLLALILEVPQLSKEKNNFTEVWAYVLIAATESITLISLALVAHQGWLTLIGKWGLMATGGSKTLTETIQSLRLENARLLEMQKKLEGAKNILEERIQSMTLGGEKPSGGYGRPRMEPVSFPDGPIFQNPPEPETPPPAYSGPLPIGFHDSGHVPDGESLNPDDKPPEVY